MLRSIAELQAQAIRGMEETRVLGKELRQAKVRVAELAAELRIKVEALESKVESKDTLLQAKDAIIQAKDSEIRLYAENARLSAWGAAAGAALRPVPTPVAPRKTFSEDWAASQNAWLSAGGTAPRLGAHRMMQAPPQH
jgi:hypothetical protein